MAELRIRWAAFSLGRLLGSLGDPDSFSVDNRIGRIHDHVFISVESGNDFNLAAEIVAERDLLQFNFLTFADRRHPQTLGAEQQRIDRQNERRRCGRQLQMHFRIGAGKKLAGRIVDRNLHQQGA